MLVVGIAHTLSVLASIREDEVLFMQDTCNKKFGVFGPH